MSSVLSQVSEFNNVRCNPTICPEIVLNDLGIKNGRSVIGSGSFDNHIKIGHESRYPSTVFMEDDGHGNLAY
jgi:hypothetical protein